MSKIRPLLSYMLKVNRVSEYGVLALGYIGSKTQAQSARDVATGLGLPYEITAKTLQKLKDAGFISSTKGINGGYILLSPLSQISFAQVINAIEGPIGIMDCVGETARTCTRESFCGLKLELTKINDQIKSILEATTIDKFSDVVLAAAQASGASKANEASQI